MTATGLNRARSPLRLKIEMVLPTLSLGGMERITCDLAVELAIRGHVVGITCLESVGGPLALQLHEAGVGVRLVSCPGVRPNLLPDPSLTAHFKSLSCDVVHTHNGVWAKAALAARVAHVPAVINTLHGFASGEPRFYDALRWWAARHTAHIVAVSEPLREHLVTSNKVSSAKISVLPNGIDTARFAPGKANGHLRHRLGVAHTNPLVGCIARLDPVKNHSALISAFANVAAICPQAHLVMIGDGPLRSELERQVCAMELSGKVHFTGELTDIADLYRDLDVFALASHYEGTSISILEALASGVPVVATDVGGNRALLERGECGLLVPPNDPQTLAEAMASILMNPRLGEKLAVSGRDWVTSSYSLEAMVHKYESIYYELLRR